VKATIFTTATQIVHGQHITYTVRAWGHERSQLFWIWAYNDE